jgi:cellobiose-specific phosphotransferase system component IIA
MMGKIFKTITRTVPVPLTPEELQAAGETMAEAFNAVMAEKENQKQVKSELKAVMDKLNEEHYKAWRTVNMKAKEVDIKVDFIIDEGMVTEVRQDTGEILLKRKAEPDEMQGEF